MRSSPIGPQQAAGEPSTACGAAYAGLHWGGGRGMDGVGRGHRGESGRRSARDSDLSSRPPLAHLAPRMLTFPASRLPVAAPWGQFPTQLMMQGKSDGAHATVKHLSAHIFEVICERATGRISSTRRALRRAAIPRFSEENMRSVRVPEADGA
ncbi:unnamed protein product [Prorocentrum cordatum]|uniref:Uncharacterized protein n=1 Tax=Prorocentrum cordatum TaxID=2364126 RepID=A0ABN9PQR7_9DINO|nr:unnamed protein product [Polarella glacialis]